MRAEERCEPSIGVQLPATGGRSPLSCGFGCQTGWAPWRAAQHHRDARAAAGGEQDPGWREHGRVVGLQLEWRSPTAQGMMC